MDLAKEAISKHYNGEKAKYEVYWTIFDGRWILLHHLMHAIPTLLNLRSYYDNLKKHDEKTAKGIYEVLLKMFGPNETRGREAFNSQLVDYMNVISNIFSPFAKMTLHVKPRSKDSPIISRNEVTNKLEVENGTEEECISRENDGL
ncbi:hypothetical protein QJS10_CPB14g00916 [Acorus calamus]|uniref:Uncharacterized protein n=1 Tax=Acorus calamus TaxID=4465 RepID=A0AAV9DCK4_ACOCL|nr:hypothetical protein QJS10_CPB14g00916 [Acorus calamus]